MGMTVEFYSAKPQELVELFSMRDVTGDFDTFFNTLETYSVADFSFHLHIPEDMDSLCKALRKQRSLIPYLFRDMFVEQVWSDGISESLTLLEGNFASTLATMNEREIEQAALEWVATFPYHEPPRQTPAYQSLIQLRVVAIDAHIRKQSLLFHLDGSPEFFRW